MSGNPCDVYSAAGVRFYYGCGRVEFFASGACLAVGKDVFESLGGFDEKLFPYHDNVNTAHEVVGLFYVAAFLRRICGRSFCPAARASLHLLYIKR